MKIRFLTTIATSGASFMRGQVIDVPEPTSEMLAWLQPLPDGTRRAEVVRDEPAPEVAIVPVESHEAAVKPEPNRRGRRARGVSVSVSDE